MREIVFVWSLERIPPFSRWHARSAAVCDQVAAVRRVVREWRERSRGREELAGLDERMLRDIGISRAEAQRESDKLFWRA